jgi:hypothetical protein
MEPSNIMGEGGKCHPGITEKRIFMQIFVKTGFEGQLYELQLKFKY